MPLSLVVNVSAGNLIAVSVSPVWIILSAIDASLLNVDTPVTSSPFARLGYPAVQ